RRSRRADLVDRGEAGLEAVARRAQVEPPHAHTLGAGQPRRLLEIFVEPACPVAQRLGVVLAEVLDVVGLQPRALEREQYARERLRRPVGEDVAGGEVTGLRILLAQV